MVNPVPGYGVSTQYRVVGAWWKTCGWHTGLDIAAPKNTPVVAPVPGTIRHRFYGSCFGKFQFVISPDPGSTGDPLIDNGEVFFAHTLSRLPDGTKVKVGQVISRVGSEGCSSGPHLHMELSSRKQAWDCGTRRNPQRVIDWRPAGSKPPSSGWKHPAGTKVYQKFTKFDGHEQNPDRHSISIECIQEMLKKHGYSDLPITGKYWTQTDEAVRADQGLHLPPADPVKQSFVGPKQFAHLKAATKAPYEWVAEDTGTPPPVTPPPPTVDKPARPALSYPNSVWEPISKSGGGWFTGLRPFKGTAKKVTLHTTETSVKPNWAQQQLGIPHFTANLKGGTIYQHLPLDVAAYTLKGGDNSPNSDSGTNIQIEIIGFTRDAPSWSDEEYLRLRVLLEWLGSNLGIPVVAPVPFDKPPRLKWEQWAPLSGILLHAHVPYNDHHDITGLDADRLLTSQKPTEPPVQPPEPPPGGYVPREEYEALKADLDAWRKNVARTMAGE